VKRFKIEHITGFKYDREVVASYNEARMLPARDNRQTVFSSVLEITPKGFSHELTDYFGSHPVMFEVLEPHTELNIRATSVVEVGPTDSTRIDATWDEISAAAKTDLSLTDASAQTRRTQPPGELGRLAKKLASQFGPHETALKICKHIYGQIKYQHGVTGVHSVASDAWAVKVGVCQDFAHLAIGALRAVGIPARYVSGYLMMKDRVEQDAGHAWAEAMVEGLGWVGFDISNGISPDPHYVRVATGRDYRDAAPTTGIRYGIHDEMLHVKLAVSQQRVEQ